MGQILIVLTTAIVVGALLIRSIKNNRKIKTVISRLVKEINITYKLIFTEKRLITRITQGAMIIAAEIFAFISISTSVSRNLEVHLSGYLDLLAKILVSIVSFVIVHYAIGYVLYSGSKIHKFIYMVENKNFKINFILTYFIISSYLTVLIIFPEQFNKNALVGLVGVGLGYCLNMKILLDLMINPKNAKGIREEEASFSRIIIAALLILILLILNLYLGVCLVNGLGENVYANATGYFDLFYYTIITFTTIGYGDIIPTTMAAKVLAIIISITSVVCLTVFLGSILSYKDKLNS